MSDGASNEPVIASTPTPLSVEPRTAAPAEVAEVARQADEAKVAANDKRPIEKKADPVEPEAKVAPRSIKDAIRAAEKKVNAEPVAEKALPIKVDPVAKEAAPAVVKDAPVAKDAKVADAPLKDAKAAEGALKSEPAAAITRGEDGKFVSTKAAEPVAPAADAPKAAEPAKPALPSHTAEPPPKRFAKEAQEDWAAAPERVRAEVLRMEKELTAGFEKNRAAAERDAGLAEFHEQAGKSGKTLKAVVADYVNMENVLRTNPDKGLESLFQNLGISPREWAAKVLGQTPDAAASAADQRVIALEKELAAVKAGLGTIHQERAAAATNTTTEMVTKFAAENPRFEELSDDIAFFLKTRTKDLAEAYKLAERLNPAPAAPAPAPEPVVASSAPAALPKPTLVPPVAQNPDAGTRSIAGTPTAGSDPVSKVRSSSIKEAIRRATAAAG